MRSRNLWSLSVLLKWDFLFIMQSLFFCQFAFFKPNDNTLYSHDFSQDFEGRLGAFLNTQSPKKSPSGHPIFLSPCGRPYIVCNLQL